jgi:Ulp1 family protease
VSAATDRETAKANPPAAPAAVTVDQLRCLLPGEWLNDAVIYKWMTYVAGRNQRLNVAMAGSMPSVYIMDTFAYTRMFPRGGFDYTGVRRWTKNVDLFGKDMIFFPLHQGTHWALAVVNMRAKKIQYFDSMGGDRKAAT